MYDSSHIYDPSIHPCLQAELWAEPTVELMTKQASSGKPLDRYLNFDIFYLNFDIFLDQASRMCQSFSMPPCTHGSAQSDEDPPVLK